MNDASAMNTALDHIVFATSNLALATEAFADLTGCLPIPGGPHPVMGTRNALVSFGDGVYLEIIGPDPERKVDGLQAAAMAALERDSLFAWALATTDLQGIALNASRMGLEPSAPTETSRTLPDGTKLTWELLWLHKMSGTWPFFIDWLDAPHPSVDSPKVGALLAFTVDLPVDDSNRLPFETPARVELRTGAPRMSLAFESIRGPIEWSADDPKGFFL